MLGDGDGVGQKVVLVVLLRRKAGRIGIKAEGVEKRASLR